MFSNVVGNFWGGFAAMLVALPSAIAFGVTIYAPLGLSPVGAIAGILGVVTLGIIATSLGGTNRLISAPCAPAAAVLSAFAIEGLKTSPADSVAIMIAITAILAGLFQVLFGSIKLGQLIKYMPYPVVSGYLSGVGLYIIASQTPKFFGVPKEFHFFDTISNPSMWQWQSMSVGAVTIISMIIAPKITKLIPAVIIALFLGVLSYFALSYYDASLLINTNPFVVGPISSDVSILDTIYQKFVSFQNFDIKALEHLIVPALTLAVLLSIDTLKTCVVLDAMTHSRHQSNRELIAQGMANITSSCIGGMPGAGTMGATLVNMSSGATNRLSGVIEGVLALIVFLALGSLIAWVPISALAGILIVIGFKMIDIHSFNFLKLKSTLLDFIVIISVVGVALSVSLIMASAVGIILAIILFIKGQISTTIIHRRMLGSQIFSKQIRVEKEMEILQEHGEESVIYELQGSLFFGTSNQLIVSLEDDIKNRKYITLDMRRVQSVDLTAGHILEQIRDMLKEKNGYLIFSRVPKSLPTGQDVEKYFTDIGLCTNTKIFDDIDDAIEWVENHILQERYLEKNDEIALELSDFELFKNRKNETIEEVMGFTKLLSFKAGDRIFSQGDEGDEIYLIAKGKVRIVLQINENLTYHISTFAKGSFFGEFSFLDGASRSADAIAEVDTEIFSISRANFDTLAQDHKRFAIQFMAGIARVLATRLRITNTEITAMD